VGAAAERDGIEVMHPARDYPKEYPVGLFFRSRGENPSWRILPGLTMGSSKLVQPPIYPAAKSALKDFHFRESCTEQNGQCAVFF